VGFESDPPDQTLQSLVRGSSSSSGG